MPDGFNLAPPRVPYATAWPSRTRSEVVVDQAGMWLWDPATASFVGFDTTWGPGAPLQRLAYAQRTEGTRNL